MTGGARSSNNLLLQLKENQRTFAQCTQRFADNTSSNIKRLEGVLQWRLEHLTGASLLQVAEVHDALAR
jgi:hypothetical protein